MTIGYTLNSCRYLLYNKLWNYIILFVYFYSYKRFQNVTKKYIHQKRSGSIVKIRFYRILQTKNKGVVPITYPGKSNILPVLSVYIYAREYWIERNWKIIYLFIIYYILYYHMGGIESTYVWKVIQNSFNSRKDFSITMLKQNQFIKKSKRKCTYII